MKIEAVLAAVGSVFGACGVAAAAAGAHLTNLPNLPVAAQFLLIHAAAIIGLAALSAAFGGRKLVAWSAVVLAVGVVLFSGSLIWSDVFGASPMSSLAPVGGTTLIVGWLFSAVAGLSLLRR